MAKLFNLTSVASVAAVGLVLAGGIAFTGIAPIAEDAGVPGGCDRGCLESAPRAGRRRRGRRTGDPACAAPPGGGPHRAHAPDPGAGVRVPAHGGRRAVLARTGAASPARHDRRRPGRSPRPRLPRRRRGRITRRGHRAPASGCPTTHWWSPSAPGANPPCQRALTWTPDTDDEVYGGLLRDIEEGYSTKIAFVIPLGVPWPLPAYELALMTAWDAHGMGIDGLHITIYTPENAPLDDLRRRLHGGAARGPRGRRHPGRDRRVRHRALRRNARDRPRRAAARRQPRRRPAACGRSARLPASPTTHAASSAATEHGQAHGSATVWAAGDAIAFPDKAGRPRRAGGGRGRRGDRRARRRGRRAPSRSGRCCAASCSPGAGRRGCVATTAAERGSAPRAVLAADEDRRALPVAVSRRARPRPGHRRGPPTRRSAHRPRPRRSRRRRARARAAAGAPPPCVTPHPPPAREPHARSAAHHHARPPVGEPVVMIAALGLVLVLLAILAGLSVRILKQYERGVQFRLGKVKNGARGPGLITIIPLVDRLHRVSLRIVTMPIQSQGIITRDNVSVDVSAVAYFRVKDVDALGGGDRERLVRHQPDRPDDAARGRRAPHAGRDAVGDRHDQPEHPRDPRRADRGVGHRGHGRRAQGHPAARQHAARDGAPGRGRAREAREDHRRPGRGPRRRRARRTPPT